MGGQEAASATPGTPAASAKRRRRAEILAFRQDPDCRLFLSTDSGGVGLNLQNASVVINCDLPWNPAKLEQRIARAWRKHQTRPVTVVNLVAENTIEHGMLETLAMKQGLSEGVLDLRGNLDAISLKGGGRSFMNRLQVILTGDPAGCPREPALPPDRPQAFARECSQCLVMASSVVRSASPCSEPGSTVTFIVERDAAMWRPRIEEIHQRLFADQLPDEPTRILVLDRSTLEALDALQAAGLVQRSERASRPLDGIAAPPHANGALTAEQKHQIAALLPKLEHRHRVAKALVAAELHEDALPPLLSALLHASESSPCAINFRVPVQKAIYRAPHGLDFTCATSARANPTSSASATQQGPTFQPVPAGPLRPSGNAMMTPSGSIRAGYGELVSSLEPELPIP